MSIGNELSYDVAAAVLLRKEKNQENPTRTEELLTVLVNFHTALQPLMKQARRRRWLATNNAKVGTAASSSSSTSNSFGN